MGLHGSAPCPSGWRLLLAGILATFLLGGCVIRVAYEQLDWLALWYLEDYFDLQPEQERVAREIVARTLAWHREEHLPRYAGLTRKVIDAVGTPVQPPFVAQRYAEAVLLWDELLARVLPDAAILLRSLTDEQVDELFANLAKENRDLAEDFSGSTAAERRSKQDKVILKAFRRFTGRLNGAQETMVRARTARFHDLSDDWLRRRETWQQEFRRLLDARATDPAFEVRLGQLLLTPERFDSDDYRRQVADNRQSAFDLVAAVLNSLEAAQLQHLRDRLSTWADDFDTLVRAGRKRSQPEPVT
ncbi:MAG: hypothetical protein J0M16_03150 [Gammaproteobacteria bacterium]|nr:hypothetical protein [Gammaproteobacteria bacterium]